MRGDRKVRRRRIGLEVSLARKQMCESMTEELWDFRSVNISEKYWSESGRQPGCSLFTVLSRVFFQELSLLFLWCTYDQMVNLNQNIWGMSLVSGLVCVKNLSGHSMKRRLALCVSD